MSLPVASSSHPEESLDRNIPERDTSSMKPQVLPGPPTPWKLPPREKIHEALSAVLDDRIELIEPLSARVWSSDRSKSYSVTWNEDRTAFGSNDNASYFQGYIGYPIISALLKLGVLQYDCEVSKALKDVPWKAINTKFKNKYHDAVNSVLTERIADQNERQSLDDYVDRLFSDLSKAGLIRLRPASPPPK